MNGFIKPLMLYLFETKYIGPFLNWIRTIKLTMLTTIQSVIHASNE